MQVRDHITSDIPLEINMIPLQPYKHFIGRNAELARIEHLVDEGHEAATIGLAGTG